MDFKLGQSSQSKGTGQLSLPRSHPTGTLDPSVLGKAPAPSEAATPQSAGHAQPVDQPSFGLHSASVLPQLSVSFVTPSEAPETNPPLEAATVSFPALATGAARVQSGDTAISSQPNLSAYGQRLAVPVNLQARGFTGTALFTDFVARRLENVSTQTKAKTPDAQSDERLDYAYAKISTRASYELLPTSNAMAVLTIQRALENCQTHLKAFNPDAKPLSAEDITTYNTVLKEYGFMTDGVQLYNLSVKPVTSADGLSSKPATCSALDIQNVLDFAKAAQVRPESSGQQDFQQQVRTAFRIEKPRLGSQRAQQIPVIANPNLIPLPTSKADVTIGTNGPPVANATVQKMLKLRNEHRAAMNVAEQSTGMVSANIKAVDVLISEQEMADQRVSNEIVRNDNLRGHLSQESDSLLKLKPRVEALLGASDLGLAVGQNLTDVNQDLAPLSLSLQRDSQGQLQFQHQGQAISEAQFRSLLVQGFANQTAKVRGLRSDLEQSSTQLVSYQRASNQVSVKLEKAAAGLHSQIAELPQTLAGLQQHRQSLMEIRSNPAAWNELDPQQQQELETMLKQTDTAIAKLKTTEQRGTTVMAQATEQLSRSEKVRGRAQQALGASREILKTTQVLLNDAGKTLERFRAQLDKERAAAENARELIAKADALEATLALTPGPNLAQLSKASADWLIEIDKIARSFEQHQTGQSRTQAIALQNLARVARTLRENLSYQEEKLQNLANSGRERLIQTLKDSINAVRALQNP